MKKLLGQYLVEKQAITPDQLRESLECQVIFGGRLGSILVELEYISCEELEDHLAARTGIELAPLEWLESPTKEAIESLPRDVIARYRVLPLHIEDRTVHVAMLDPDNPAQVDDIAFACGMRVRPYTISEQRLDQWLLKRFDIKRMSKSIVLDRKTGWGRFKDQRAGEPQAKPGPPGFATDAQPTMPVAPAREDLARLGIGGLAAGEELTSEADLFDPATGQLLDAREPAPEALVEIEAVDLEPVDIEPADIEAFPAPTAEPGADAPPTQPLPDPFSATEPKTAPTPAPVAEPTPAPTPAPAAAPQPTPAPVPKPEPAPAPAAAASAQPRAADDKPAVRVNAAAATPQVSEGDPLAAPRSAEERTQIQQSLDAARSADDVVLATLRLARESGRVVVFFWITADGVEGYRGVGAGLDGRRLSAIRVSRDAETGLRDPVRAARPWIASHPTNAIEQELFQQLHKRAGSQFGFFPIREGEDALALLYVDRGTGAFEDHDLIVLGQLTDQVGEALTRLSSTDRAHGS